MEDSLQTLKKKIEGSSKEVREALSKKVWSQVVNEIVQKNNLSAEQSTALENEIIFVLAGMELSKNLRNNIEGNVGLSWNMAMSVADKISAKVFIPLKEFLPTTEEVEPSLKSLPEVKSAQQTSLAPSVTVENDLPMIVPNEKAKVALTFEERKKLVPSIPDNKHHYEGGKDPYREPT
ncbi:MAG: hypothetical protein AAB660_00230 [Patescibacteria group bacterium]